MKRIEARLTDLERRQQTISTVAAKLALLDSGDENTRMSAAAEIMAYVHGKVPAIATSGQQRHGVEDAGRILHDLEELGVLPPICNCEKAAGYIGTWSTIDDAPKR